MLPGKTSRENFRNYFLELKYDDVKQQTSATSSRALRARPGFTFAGKNR